MYCRRRSVLPNWASRSASWKIIGGRTRLKVVPYALYSEAVLEDSVTSMEIADGSVTAADLEDGAALAEIADDDGEGSGLDADLLDGLHAAAFSLSGHDHDVDYVNEGQVGSVTGAMILDGEITDDDVRLSGQHGRDQTRDVLLRVLVVTIGVNDNIGPQT